MNQFYLPHRRKRPAYVPPSAVLQVPRQTLEETVSALENGRALGVESCCFWYGPRVDGDVAVVTAVVVPKQQNARLNYHVPADAIVEMSAATRPLGLVTLVQVHTHPSSRVDHSAYDDENAISRNALSIVLPNYGMVSPQWPKEAGVHEFQGGVWHRLSVNQSYRRIEVVDGTVQLIDLR